MDLKVTKAPQIQVYKNIFKDWNIFLRTEYF